MKRFFAFLSLFALILSLTACSSGIAPIEETTEAPTLKTNEEVKEMQTTTEEKVLTPEQQQILSLRREKVVDYMTKMASVLWRSDEEIVYTIKSGVSPDQVKNGSGSPVKLTIEKGRLYQGLPYTYAGNGIPSFADFYSATDEKGVATVSGMVWQDLSGGFQEAMIGNDCSTAVMQAWGQIGANSFTVTNTQYMTADQGYLPVGSYRVAKNELYSTKGDCARNGKDVMFASYAALQKGDAVVQRNNGAGHTMLVTSVHAVPLGNGYDPKESYITVTHQTRGKYSKEAKYYSEEHGEDVYYWYGIDDKYTFASLLSAGYLPITCKELIDPAPIAELQVTFTPEQGSPDELLAGTIHSNHLMEKITAEIKNDKGEVVQSAFVYPTRKAKNDFPCEILIKKGKGKIDLSALPKGSYTLTYTVLLSDGTTATARELAFTR
ncbi:MAG: hypothetical protein E7580_00785 [Ruminococcaceae bacterium]|nr:hypothetical protein [Oscillospiraceae bacterium]